VLVGEILPRLAVGAVDFAHRAPGLLAEVKRDRFLVAGGIRRRVGKPCMLRRTGWNGLPDVFHLGGFRCLQQRLDGRHDMVDGEPELLLQGLQWCGRPKSVHADDPASPPDVALPAEC
jgi:hypothetical protein